MSFKKRYPLISYGNNLFKIKGVIGGNKKGDFHRINLLLDTGSSFTIVASKILIDLQYDLKQSQKKQQIVTGKGITSPISVISLSWFNCAGKIVNNFEVLAYDIPPALRVDAILGMNFLVQYRAIIDLCTQEIYFMD